MPGPARGGGHCFIKLLIGPASGCQNWAAARMGDELRLYVGDNWAEDHNEVDLMAEDGRVLARARA